MMVRFDRITYNTDTDTEKCVIWRILDIKDMFNNSGKVTVKTS